MSSPSPREGSSAAPARAGAAAARCPASASAAHRLQRSRSLMRVQAEAQQPLLQGYVGRERGHLAAMDDGAVVHYQHLVAELARGMKILLDQQDGGATALDL